MTPQVHIGTSGWHYPHWVGPFYPSDLPSSEFLAYYARHFKTVEINNTFYQLPTPHTLRTWCDMTPQDFVFACKASRYITHLKKLTDPTRSIARFVATLATLGDKLGPVLFQLPPHWRMNLERLQTFLRALPAGLRCAFEFRDPSWFEPETYETLAAFNAAFCVYDLTGQKSPAVRTADFVYIRLHGPDAPYRGHYAPRVLRRWANQCTRWIDAGVTVYCYFDNDEAGYAVRDALALAQLIG